MRVLVIPEDFRKDQYLLRPLLSRLFQTIGKRHVRVEICRAPLLGGVDQALKSNRIAEVMSRHGGMAHLIVLCVDRDGNLGRHVRLGDMEREFGTDRRAFLAENAWEELETWVLAGLALPGEWLWSDVRAEVHVKERYFDPLARQRGFSDAPGGGRKPLGMEAARRIDAIRQKCPEDFDCLARRLEAAVRAL
ncbi:MAG: hypothetical protein OXQ31_22215 [Spirochaetaceae bacterium]|nr:hypothetical protein [Spirochaetaceae bacterium]